MKKIESAFDLLVIISRLFCSTLTTTDHVFLQRADSDQLPCLRGCFWKRDALHPQGGVENSQLEVSVSIRDGQSR